jgi:protein gp37
MAETKIEWTSTLLPDGTVLPGYTFNPWVGCTKVSAACDFCYAEGWAKRAGEPELWKGTVRRTSAANWRLPLKWNKEAEASGIRRKVFCASLADVFDNQADPEWRADLWILIAKTPHLDWLLLTKRPQNIAKMLPVTDSTKPGYRPWNILWPAGWSNVWLGTTIENKTELSRRAKHLKSVPASVHFWSAEPLLEDLGEIPADILPDWVICGGESGPKARPIHSDWVRSLRDQCASAGVPFLWKQWGEFVEVDGRRCKGHGHRRQVDNRETFFVRPDGRLIAKGDPEWGHCSVWGADSRVIKIGKKAAGRLLDGVLHDGYPKAGGA